MLLGKELSNQEWEIRYSHDQPLMVCSTSASMFANLPARTLINRLGTAHAEDELFYYVFQYSGAARFILCSHERINFACLSFSENKKQNGEFALIVNAALFDLKSGKFVNFFGKKKDYFYEFVLYDCGVPNCVFDKKTGSYSLFYFIDNYGKMMEFVSTKPLQDPIFVSHVDYNYSLLREEISRAIFYVGANDAPTMLLLKKELSLEFEKPNVEFLNVETPYGEEDACDRYHVIAHNSRHHFVDPSVYSQIAFMKVKHIANNDVVIVKDELGTYGEKVILTFTPGKPHYDADQLSMIDYEKYEKALENEDFVLKIWYRRNDFENSEAFVDCSEGRVAYNY